MNDIRLERAANVIKDGGLVIYPTETFYGVGADALNREALARIIALKGRPENKPLPLILGSSEQLNLVTAMGARSREESAAHRAAEDGADDFQLLADLFWPGPLSILIKTKPGLPPEIQDRQAYSSVRVSGNDVARRLALAAGRPIIATSANLSGRPPAAKPADLASEMLQGVDCVLDERPWPSGGLPSTVVRLLGRGRLVIVRQGAVKRENLVSAGFVIEAG